MDSLVSELFERHHIAVLRFFRRLTGNPDLAENMTQEVLVHVVKGFCDYRPDGREAGWVFRIAQNVLADHYRRQRHLPSPLSDPEALAASSPPGQLLAFGVQEALNRLPEPERTAFLLREVAGLSYREVGAICQTTEAGVGSRLYRARRRLQHLLSGRLTSDSRREFTKDRPWTTIISRPCRVSSMEDPSTHRCSSRAWPIGKRRSTCLSGPR